MPDTRPATELSVAEYDQAEQEAMAQMPNRVIMAFQPVVFQEYGYPARVRVGAELLQQIRPLCTIPTRCGPLRCVAGHGRLRWRTLTFYTEEPQTIAWLDSLTEHDLLWDVGANVGLYAIYAAKVARCKVVAFEPEAQNYALLQGTPARALEERVAVCEGGR